MPLNNKQGCLKPDRLLMQKAQQPVWLLNPLLTPRLDAFPGTFLGNPFRRSNGAIEGEPVMT